MNLGIFGFYALIAILYYAKAPKPLLYFLLALSTIGCLMALILLKMGNNILGVMTYPDIKTQADCEKPHGQNECGRWDPATSSCLMGMPDRDTNACVKMEIPGLFYAAVAFILIINILMMHTVYKQKVGKR